VQRLIFQPFYFEPRPKRLIRAGLIFWLLIFIKKKNKQQPAKTNSYVPLSIKYQILYKKFVLLKTVIKR